MLRYGVIFLEYSPECPATSTLKMPWIFYDYSLTCFFPIAIRITDQFSVSAPWYICTWFLSNALIGLDWLLMTLLCMPVVALVHPWIFDIWLCAGTGKWLRIESRKVKIRTWAWVMILKISQKWYKEQLGTFWRCSKPPYGYGIFFLFCCVGIGVGFGFGYSWFVVKLRKNWCKDFMKVSPSGCILFSNLFVCGGGRVGGGGGVCQQY